VHFFKAKLRTLLLSVFLFTIVASSLAIVSFTYSKYTKSIRTFSKGTIDRAGKSILARIDCLIRDSEKISIIGEVTAKAIGPRFLLRPLEIVEVRGKKKKLKVFELVGAFEEDPSIAPTPEQVELCTAFTKAYEAYEQGTLEEAKRLFLAIHARFPGDLPTKLFLDRLKA